MIGIITGSGLYDVEVEDKKEQEIETEYGSVTVTTGKVGETPIAHIARHGKNHELLPNMINSRANLAALKKIGVECIISTTVCGIINPDIALATPLMFKDLYFPDNRLPSGELCTIYTKKGDKKRGHYIFGFPFSEQMRKIVKELFEDINDQLTYAHVNGPRFNTASEIRALQNHADVISQTSGPEVILAGELEIPMILIGFGIDYANQVKDEPTPMYVLNENLNKSSEVFKEIIKQFCEGHNQDEKTEFGGFVYRFEKEEE